MKSLKMILAYGLTVLAVTACGNGSTQNGTTVANSCGVGSVYTQYGCVPQGQCPSGQGMYNNTCIMGSNNNSYNVNSCTVGQVLTQYGCVPQSSCPAGQGFYNNTCIPAITSTTNNGYNTGYNTGYNNGYSNTGSGTIGGVINYNYGYGTTGGYGSNNNFGCATGTLSTQMGCLPTTQCGPASVLYNNYCRTLTPAYGASFQYYVNY